MHVLLDRALSYLTEDTRELIEPLGYRGGKQLSEPLSAWGDWN